MLLDREGNLRAVVGLAMDGSPFVRFVDEEERPDLDPALKRRAQTLVADRPQVR